MSYFVQHLEKGSIHEKWVSKGIYSWEMSVWSKATSDVIDVDDGQQQSKNRALWYTRGYIHPFWAASMKQGSLSAISQKAADPGQNAPSDPNWVQFE